MEKSTAATKVDKMLLDEWFDGVLTIQVGAKLNPDNKALIEMNEGLDTALLNWQVGLEQNCFSSMVKGVPGAKDALIEVMERHEGSVNKAIQDARKLIEGVTQRLFS